MTDLIVPINKEPDGNGSVVKITPESAGWEYVGFEVLRLADGRVIEHRTDVEEICLVVLSGYCTVSTADDEWRGIGEIDSVFEGTPHAVYLPPGTDYRVEAVTYLELAIASAPGQPGMVPFDPLHVRPEDIEVETRGHGNTERRIHPILMEDRRAERLLVVEVITPNGHWSSYPPHKHDQEDPPNETRLEETYYHKVRPTQGFAVQRVYTDDRSLDETLTVRDDDTVLVPRGYHPVCAAPGYDLYYLNVMAGPARQWRIQTDPSHEWLL